MDRWHRDTAYRLMVDHSRALAHALSDGLVPGRQGLGLKLRQLIHRAARASVLTGLDPLKQSCSVLGGLVAEVARTNQLAVPSAMPLLQGPSARFPSRLSYEEMEALVTKEVLAFLPRLEGLEEAFNRCLDENPEATRLSRNPTSSSSTSSLSSGKTSRSDPSAAMVYQLQRANCVPTDDSDKYRCHRVNTSTDSASSYGES
ncbi:unnamed protein product [Echinostoma caproni]|uniref:Alanyl-tRNA synthetase class IIc N-terminal domain-containing protein n=1 Tax=Echinostoma caproni TaxID=27848 RepID=A0A3P8L3T9_9TREM|nr:unnamed protein product [Echinostoma caproni]